MALHAVKIACELPQERGRPIGAWTCAAIARELIATEIVGSISAETVRRMLKSQKLKPWRVHHWLSPRVLRDDAFHATLDRIESLYTGALGPHEAVVCVDENTSLQPRSRLAPTMPAGPDRPVTIEHEYKRGGALHLFAAFDTRTGRVMGRCFQRKRSKEFIGLLEAIDAATPARVTTIHVIADNSSVHKSKETQAWLAEHARFRPVFLPVHCSWLNQVEQWFSVLQREVLRHPNFASRADLALAIGEYIADHNTRAHPYNWTAKSFDHYRAKPADAVAA